MLAGVVLLGLACDLTGANKDKANSDATQDVFLSSDHY
jgi:hypothetical protein